jgi:hypothetical protein
VESGRPQKTPDPDFQRRKQPRIHVLNTIYLAPDGAVKNRLFRSLDTCNSYGVTDAVAARRIVRQAFEDLLRASYQNQTSIQEHPMAKAKKTVKKVAAKKPAAKKAVKKVAAKKKK